MLSALLLVPFVVAPTANADNESFLAAVSSLQSEEGPAGLLKVGKGACSIMQPDGALWFGRHPNVAADIVWQNNPMMERPEAVLLVNAAIDHLCPGVNPFGYAG